MAKIKNNDTRARVLPQRPKPTVVKDKDGRSRGLVPAENAYGPVRVEPGGRVSVPDEYLDSLLKVGVMETAFATGVLEANGIDAKELQRQRRAREAGEAGEDSAPSTKDDLEDLVDLTVKAAEPLIAAETRKDVLSRWHDADGRRGVRDAITARIEELSQG